jgi:hypothetical protein
MAGVACLDPGKGLASATESYARSKAYDTSATPNPPPSRIRWAKRLLIRAGGHVSGTITYGEIEIESGGKITGVIEEIASNNLFSSALPISA